MRTQLKYVLLLLLVLSSCIDVIVKKDDPPDYKDEIIRILDERFPLMKAVREGKLDEVKRLLKIELFKKNVDQQDEDGNTALLFAAEQGYEDILDLLLQAGADPNLSDFKQRTPLISAAYKGKINIVKNLLQIDTVKENINNQDINGNTALIFSAKRGYEDILDLLLQAGADPDLSDFKQRTPLMSAAYKGKINVVKNLLQIDTVKENINNQDINGNTALIFTVKRGYEDILDLLLQTRADPDLSNFRESTPLMEAVIRGKTNIVKRLVQIKTVRNNINATDKDGNTALSLANERGYKQIASLLLEAGAIPPVKDTFLNIKKIFKKIFFLEEIREEDQFRKTASKSEGRGNWLQSFFERITSFFKNLF